MELGNICFGNSRGTFEIGRHSGYEGQLQRLFLACVDHDDVSYGIDYENDTFFCMPYYWGDCTCGFEGLTNKWSSENDHSQECYHYLVINELLERTFIKKDGWCSGYRADKPISMTQNQARIIEEGVRKRYCKELNLPYPAGCAIHCTCNYEKKWNKFLSENDHKKDCPVVLPNFLYKPTGFEIQWYKYPLRDAYMNEDISLREFIKIIDKCIESI